MTAEHPAKFTDSILDVISDILRKESEEKREALMVLDPFAGTGKIHSIGVPGMIETYGIEIEPEWANQHHRTQVGDALNLPLNACSMDVIATSPTYGNRMADHHNAQDGSKRITYTHRLGRKLHENNSGAMHWGPKYREFHEAAWREADRVLVPGGLFIINVKNFHRTVTIKGKRVQEVVDVVGWHHDFITSLGYSTVTDVAVPVTGMGFGQNGKRRISHERVIAMRKGSR